MKPLDKNREQSALLVHSNFKTLSVLQAALTQHGFTAINARDLASALLAITHHHFDLVIVAASLSERGDGWPLAGVLRMVFPKAYVAVLAEDTGVPELQAAINHGVDQVYSGAGEPGELINSILAKFPSLAA
jgi:DNA-binding response OmpR family regulator